MIGLDSTNQLSSSANQGAPDWPGQPPEHKKTDFLINNFRESVFLFQGGQPPRTNAIIMCLHTNIQKYSLANAAESAA